MHRDDCSRGCRAPDRILNKEQWPDGARRWARLRRGPAGVSYDGPGCKSSNTDREQEFQYPSLADRYIAEGAAHIRWQREVIAILERISVSAEAIEGARALLTTFLQTQAQREQERDRIRKSPDCNLDLSTKAPLAQPVEHQNEPADVGRVARPHLCADRTPVQLGAKKLENLDEGRPSDAVLQDDVALNISHNSVQSTAITQFMPTVPLARPVEQQNEAADVGGVAELHLSVDRTPVQLEANKLEKFGEGHSSETASFDAVLKDEAAPIEPKGLLAQLVDRLGRIIRSLLVCR